MKIALDPIEITFTKEEKAEVRAMLDFIHEYKPETYSELYVLLSNSKLNDYKMALFLRAVFKENGCYQQDTQVERFVNFACDALEGKCQWTQQ